MSQENTKLCDFFNTNNNDFISTPIASPATRAELCDINAGLVNLVMKEQFSGSPTENAASHLNTFVELCDMQKKKDVDNDIIKLKLLPFSLRDRAKTWFSSLPRNSIDSWDKCKGAFITKYLRTNYHSLAFTLFAFYLHLPLVFISPTSNFFYTKTHKYFYLLVC
jgi:hypothetical protein